MTTVIDSLVLEFGIDPKLFSKGQTEAVQKLRDLEVQSIKTGNEVERQQSKMTAALQSFRREAVGAIAGLVGGYGAKEFITNMTNTDAAVGRVSKTLNMSARELGAWQGAAKATGGTAEGITGTLQGITQDMNKFMLTGQGALAGLRIGIFDANHNLKTAGELLLEMADASKQMDPARFAAFFSMIPGASQDALNLINNGRAQIEQLLKEQRALNNITPESIKAAQDYQKAVSELDTALSSLGRTIVTIAAPALTGLAKMWTHPLSKGGIFHIDEDSFLGRLFGISSGTSTAPLAAGTGLNTKEGIARKELAARMAAAANNAPGTSGGNWSNFLSGLSYLETSHHNVGNATSTAQGYFQFVNGTANKATAAGLPNPREGSYDEQAEATKRYIQRFYPQASAAIERGDWTTAENLLKGEWPSLPGGKQQQRPDRYVNYRAQLAGAGGGSQSTSTSTTTIGTIIVQTQAKDAVEIARDIKPALQGQAFGSQFNSGPQ